MNTEKFTGKAQAYANARPGYPDAAIDYIRTLAPESAVFADIGAGTGKFTELLARYGYEVFAVEPNADMREQLFVTLAPYPNAKIVDGSAEATALPDSSIDVITCAQALGWFNLNSFLTECRRIGREGSIIISIYNEMPNDNFVPDSNRLTNKQATAQFFKNPALREFPNPIFYTRDKWLQCGASISDNPLPSDSGYDAHIAEMNAVFDRENAEGLLRRDMVTKVFNERLGL
jgi:SAM-dependent methyltransferase